MMRAARPRVWRLDMIAICPLPGSALRSNVARGGMIPLGTKPRCFISLTNSRSKRFALNLNHLTLPEIQGFNTFRDEPCFKSKSKRDSGPAPDGLVRNVNAAFHHKLFNRTRAKFEPGVAPDNMSDDPRRKPLPSAADFHYLHRHRLRAPISATTVEAIVVLTPRRARNASTTGAKYQSGIATSIA